jgi:hypothetical protein
MATLTAERERYDAEPACRVAGFTLGGSRAGAGRGGGAKAVPGRQLGGAQRSTPAMMSSTVRPAKASMSRRVA